MKDLTDDIFCKLPEKLVKRLMPFQREGVKFAVQKNGRCLIADEMGLGKTLQAICVACYYKSEWPLLIVVPSSLRYSWIEEFEKWLPDINPGEINLIQSGTDSGGIGNSAVTITTFGLLSHARSNLVKEALIKQAFKVVIVDESHYMKNIKTVTAKVVVPLVKNANRRILLSGTPALARPVELFPQIDAVCPNMFGNWYSFTNRYCDAKLEWFGKGKRRNVNGASNLEELQQKLSSMLMIRREKNDVLTQLPPKQRQRILFELKDSDLKKEIRKNFDELRVKLKQKQPEECFEVLTGGGESDRKDIGTLSLIQQLYQLSGEAKVLTGGGESDSKDIGILSLIQQLYQLSGEAKIGPAKEYIEMLCDNPKLKFLIFAYHHNMMNGITQSLYDKQIKFIRIDGHTPPSDRPVLVNQFQSDPNTRVAVLSILAAGVGLTLTAATLVVFAEMYWTPGVMIQCEDRAHRIGQSNHVAVHYLIAKDTMDEWVWSAVCKKTIVTSTTLVGKKRKMEALEGDQYQIDVLSKAEAWVPKNNENLDLTDYFNTQLNPDQKSIKDFFSPSQLGAQTRLDKALTERNEKRKSFPVFNEDSTLSKDKTYSERKEKRKANPVQRKDHAISSDEDDSEDLQPIKKQRMNDTLASSVAKKAAPCLIVLDSGSEDDFATNKPKPSSVSKSKGKKSVQKSRKKNSKNVKNSPSTPKCNLVSMFSQASNKSLSQSSQENGSQSSCKQNCNQNSAKKDDSRATKTSNQWNCTTCTFLNHKELTVCEMCDTPKRSQQGFVRKRKQCESSQTDQSSQASSSRHVNSDSDVNKPGDEVTIIDDYDTDSENPFKVTPIDSNEIDYTLDSADKELAKSYYSPAKCSKYFEKSSKNGTNANHVSEHVDEECTGQVTAKPNDSIHDTSEINNIVEDIGSSKDSKGLSPGMVHDIHKSSLRTEDTDVGNEENVINVDKNNHVEASESSQCVSPIIKHKYVFKTGSSSKKYNFKSLKHKDPSHEQSGQQEKFTDVKSAEADKENCSEDIERNEVTENESKHLKADFSSSFEEEEEGNVSCKDGSAGVDMDYSDVPVHTVFKYQCSKYTGRIYLLTQDDVPLNINFIPIDVEVCNYEALPDILHHPHNLRLVQKFVREWQNLTETKKRLVIRAGRNFISPLREYEDLQSCKTLNTQRHKTKTDTAAAAHKKAAEMSGSVRVISKSASVNGQSANKGITQALDKDGTPLCVQCFKPYKNSLLDQTTIVSEENAWQTRFCTEKCAHNYWLVTNNEYIRNKIYEIEHGVCQMCQLDAHALFRQIRDTQDHKKRAELVTKSKYNTLTTNTKQQIVKKPVAGQFWHVDHIIPVWEGGGQCDMDNLRTLCVLCHHKVTAKQAGKRATARKLETAVRSHDITAFFKKS